jgi:hypothetical protein
VYIWPQYKCSRWRKVAAFCGHTRHRTVPCLVRLAVALSEQVTVGAVGFSHRTVWSSHQTVWWSSLRVPPGTSRWAAVPRCTGQSGVWAPDSLVCHRTVRCSTHKQSAGVTPDFRRQTECEPCTCQDQQFTYTAVTELDIITQCSNNDIKEGIIVDYIMMSETST